MVSFSQKVIKGKRLPPVKDTVYIGVSNIFKLEPLFTPLAVEPTNGGIRVDKDEIIIRPTTPGKVEILLKYQDTIIRRTFISTYLPKPTPN